METSNEIRVIVAGSRDFVDYRKLSENLDRILLQLKEKYPDRVATIVSGTARGADKLGECYAEQNELKCYRFPANWDEHGKQAGPIRNREMAKFAKECDVGVLVAFWDGISRGTKSMLNLAEVNTLEVHVVMI